VLHHENPSFSPGVSQSVNDDILFTFGADDDIAFVLNSAGLAANTELTGVIVGTSVYDEAIPANSMIISNITNDGDIVFFTATGGNSIEVARATNAGLFCPIGVRIGANSGDNEIDDTTQGAASTQLFIGNASIDVTSDERVKSDILPWKSSGLGLLSQLMVKEYAYASHVPFGNVYYGKYVGVTAQDIYKVAPWAVNTQGGAQCWNCLNGVQCDDHVNPWTFKTDLLIGVVVKSIQELEQENADLRERVLALETR